MFHRSATGFAFALLWLTASTAHAQVNGGDVSAGKYGWLSNLQEGKAHANKTRKPMMVVIRCVP